MKTERIETGIKDLLRLLGDDPNREGVKETPARVIKAYKEICNQNQLTKPTELLQKRFNLEQPAGEITVGPIPFTSICEHHLLPFTGHVHVTYRPEGSQVIGLSKLARLVQYHAATPQIQERLTSQIIQDIKDHVTPHVKCVITATHTCMTLRGPKVPNATMTTTQVSGEYSHA